MKRLLGWLPVVLLAIFVGMGMFKVYRSKKSDCSSTANLDKKFTVEPGAHMRAAACKTVITPKDQLTMGGFGLKRLALGVHDDLYAHCLMLETPTHDRLAFVTLDLVGFIRYDILKVREEVRKRGVMDPDFLIISSTHTHSGPDPIGIWSRSAFPLCAPNLSGSGRDESYLAGVRTAIVDLLEQAASKLESAELSTIESSGEGYSANIRLLKKDRQSPASGQLDVSIVTLVVKGRKGIIATLTNFGCHPETFPEDNQLLSADFPGVLTREMEWEFGGTALFANGLLGAMVSCRTDLVRKGHRTYPERAEAMGRGLTKRIISAKAGMKPVNLSGGLRIRLQLVKIPLDNFYFQEGMKSGLIPHNSDILTDQREVITEAGIVDIGDLRILVVPGEMQPGLGLEIKKMTGAKMIFCLANDEIGYIIPTADFHKTMVDDDGKTVDVYVYERTMALGPETGNKIREAFEQLATK